MSCETSEETEHSGILSETSEDREAHLQQLSHVAVQQSLVSETPEEREAQLRRMHEPDIGEDIRQLVQSRQSPSTVLDLVSLLK